jgi:hypothetical protein
MEVPLPHHYPPSQLHDGSIFQSQSHPHVPTLVSQLDLDPTDLIQFNPHLDPHHPLHTLHSRNAFDQRPLPRLHEIRSLIDSNIYDQNSYLRGGNFGHLAPHHHLPSQPQTHPEALGRLHNELDTQPALLRDGGSTEGHFSNLKMVPNPPDLEHWRKKLFDVDELITMTEDQYDRSTFCCKKLHGLKGRYCAGLRHISRM